MDLRQAPALTLLIWYLLLPALAQRAGTTESEPMTVVLGSYKTRAECERERQSLLKSPTVAAKAKATKCLPSTKVDSPLEQAH